MDTQLRRYLNGLFVLLSINIGLFFAAIIGIPVYALLINPELLHLTSSDE